MKCSETLWNAWKATCSLPVFLQNPRFIPVIALIAIQSRAIGAITLVCGSSSSTKPLKFDLENGLLTIGRFPDQQGLFPVYVCTVDLSFLASQANDDDTTVLLLIGDECKLMLRLRSPVATKFV